MATGSEEVNYSDMLPLGLIKPLVKYRGSNAIVAHLFLLRKMMVILGHLEGAFKFSIETSCQRDSWISFLRRLSEKVVHDVLGFKKSKTCKGMLCGF